MTPRPASDGAASAPLSVWLTGLLAVVAVVAVVTAAALARAHRPDSAG